MKTKAAALPLLVSLAFCTATAGIEVAGPGQSPPQIAPELLNDRWSASWIAPASAPDFDEDGSCRTYAILIKRLKQYLIQKERFLLICAGLVENFRQRSHYRTE